MDDYMLEDTADVDYDVYLECWCLHYQGEIVPLFATDYSAALEEADNIMLTWI